MDPSRLVDQFGNKLLGPPATDRYRSFMPTPWGTRVRDLPPFTFLTIQAMLMDNTIRLGMAMRLAPLVNVEFAYEQNGQWIPGIKADDPEVAQFVWQQLKRMWQMDVIKLLTAQIWGWAGAEILYKINPQTNRIEYRALVGRHARDCFALQQAGNLVGVEFHGVKDGKMRLGIPGKALWHAHRPPEGFFYGESILQGAYSPWFDKWMNGGALDVRRLFMHADAYGGRTMRYPSGTTEIEGVGVIPNRDIADDILAHIKSGSVVPLPSTEKNGKYLWDLSAVQNNGTPNHILQYPKDLEVEILRGLDIPDDYLISGETGAWAGKRVPMQAFFTSLTMLAKAVVRTIVAQLLEPLVLWNWGKAIDFEASIKPLDVQAMEQQMGQGQQGGFGQPMQQGLPGQDQSSPFQMSADPVSEAVGRGLLQAADVIRAAESVQVPSTGEEHDYASTQFNLPKSTCDDICYWAERTIDPSDLFGDKIETESHVTVKYGLHDDDPALVEHAVRQLGPVAIRLGKTQCFEGKEQDVLYISVQSMGLQNLNVRIADCCPHTDTHPKYIPHITVAYLQPGTGKKYINNTHFVGHTIGFDELQFSDKRRKHTSIPLAGMVQFAIEPRKSARMFQMAVTYVPYRGRRGGKGAKNTQTGEIIYGKAAEEALSRQGKSSVPEANGRGGAMLSQAAQYMQAGRKRLAMALLSRARKQGATPEDIKKAGFDPDQKSIRQQRAEKAKPRVDRSQQIKAAKQAAADKPAGKRQPPGAQLTAKQRERVKSLGMVGTLPPADVPLDNIQFPDDKATAKDLQFKPIMSWVQVTKSGRLSRQYRYTQAFHDRNAESKFERVMAVEPYLEDANTFLTRTIKNKSLKTSDRDAAAIAGIIAETGLRPTDGADSVKHDHFGIASLQARHVKVMGNEVRLDFIGKEGVRNRTTIKDPTLVAYIKDKLSGKSGKDSIWSAGSNQAAQVLKDAVKEAGGPEDVMLKDLRTIKATRLGREVVANFKGPPPPLTGNQKKDVKLITKAILQMSGDVAAHLNNTAPQARDNYIHPEVFRQWQSKLGVA